MAAERTITTIITLLVLSFLVACDATSSAPSGSTTTAGEEVPSLESQIRNRDATWEYQTQQDPITLATNEWASVEWWEGPYQRMVMVRCADTDPVLVAFGGTDYIGGYSGDREHARVAYRFDLLEGEDVATDDYENWEIPNGTTVMAPRDVDQSFVDNLLRSTGLYLEVTGHDHIGPLDVPLLGAREAILQLACVSLEG